MFMTSQKKKEAKATYRAEQLINELCKLCGNSRDNYANVMGILKARFTELNEEGKLK